MASLEPKIEAVTSKMCFWGQFKGWEARVVSLASTAILRPKPFEEKMWKIWKNYQLFYTIKASWRPKIKAVTLKLNFWGQFKGYAAPFNGYFDQHRHFYAKTPRKKGAKILKQFPINLHYQGYFDIKNQGCYLSKLSKNPPTAPWSYQSKETTFSSTVINWVICNFIALWAPVWQCWHLVVAVNCHFGLLWRN